MCVYCNRGMIVRSRAHGGRREYYYACGTYHQRGKVVCGNATEDILKKVDTAVLAAFSKQLGDPGVLDQVAAAAEARLASGVADGVEDVTVLRNAVAKVEAEITNLTNAIAAGAGLSSVLTALRGREDERGALLRRIQGLERGQTIATGAPSRLREELADRVSDWQGVLQRNPAQARQILKKLLVGSLVLTPKADGDERWFEFEGTASFAKLVDNDAAMSFLRQR